MTIAELIAWAQQQPKDAEFEVTHDSTAYWHSPGDVEDLRAVKKPEDIPF